MHNPQGDREQLEVSEARMIFGTYLHNKDKEQVFALCRRAEKLFGAGSSKRILGYVKLMSIGEME